MPAAETVPQIFLQTTQWGAAGERKLKSRRKVKLTSTQAINGCCSVLSAAGQEMLRPFSNPQGNLTGKPQSIRSYPYGRNMVWTGAGTQGSNHHSLPFRFTSIFPIHVLLHYYEIGQYGLLPCPTCLKP